MNETLYICYFASKHGIKYRTLVENVDGEQKFPIVKEKIEEEDIDEMEVNGMANHRNQVNHEQKLKLNENAKKIVN